MGDFFMRSLKWLILIGIGLSCAGCGKEPTGSIGQKWLDVPYANISPAQKLDIYLPGSGKAPFPAIIYIHGGGFRRGDKAKDLPLSLVALKRGYALISINYRLSTDAKFPAQVHDVKAAVRFIKAHASEYSVNPEKIALWGVSAGGTLAALAGTANNGLDLEDSGLGTAVPSCSVQAVVDWYGPIDFLKMDEQLKQNGFKTQDISSLNSRLSMLFGKKITEVPESVKMANPETYISPDDPPFFILHGLHDDVVPVQQSVNFSARLEKAIGKDKVTLVLVKDAGHGDDKYLSSGIINKMFKFLDVCLKDGTPAFPSP